jgi:hypothetical protein
MSIPVYCNAIVDAHVEGRSRHLKSPTRCCEHWGHREAFNIWLQGVAALTRDNIDEKHVLMDLAVAEMRAGLLSGIRFTQLEEWIMREKESDLVDAEMKKAIAPVGPCENFMICIKSIFMVLLLFILGTAPFILSRGLIERLFRA